MGTKRKPKADYFRERYAQAVENGLDSKADYYKTRLEGMGEPLRQTKMGKLTRSEFLGGDLVVYSF
tara:strand:+ start:2930 stop:3127 length:198 start_codon:yes stop_codon:yes gene_type:complete